MQTGFSNIVSQDTSVDDFVSNAKSMFLVLMEEGMRCAGDYARASGRDVVTQEDILYGLQYQAHQFQNIENIQARSKEAMRSWNEVENKTLAYVDENGKEWVVSITSEGFDDDDYVWEGSLSDDRPFTLTYTSDGDCEMEGDVSEHFIDFLIDTLVLVDDGMTVENHEPFKRAPDSHGEKIALMNFYHDHWHEWEPETDVEKLLKESIDSRFTDR